MLFVWMAGGNYILWLEGDKKKGWKCLIATGSGTLVQEAHENVWTRRKRASYMRS